MKPEVARQFLGKDDDTAKEMWDVVQHRYCANNAQMIPLENQLANLQVYDGPNIIEHIINFVSSKKQLVSLGIKATKEEFVHRLMTKSMARNHSCSLKIVSIDNGCLS